MLISPAAPIMLFRRKVPWPVVLWFGLALAAAGAEVLRNDFNNFHIYRQVFWHTVHQQPLFASYPSEYNDVNHYGPLFSIVIMPFAWLPAAWGCMLWALANAGILLYAIMQLPLTQQKKMLILLIGTVEMMTSLHSVQFNPMLTAWLLLAYVLVYKEKDFWAALFIAAGFWVKLYGIVGIAFVAFSKNRRQFMMGMLVWMLVFFALPMLLSSPSFILHTYSDWIDEILKKNDVNLALVSNNMQNISMIGMCSRLFGNPISPFFFLAPASLLTCMLFLKHWGTQQTENQLSLLAYLLVCIVIFSTSAESPTYVIAVTGIAIWMMLQPLPLSKWMKMLLGLVLILTSLSSTDLFPRIFRETLIIPYALKALPCCITWAVISMQLLRKNPKTVLQS